MSKPKFIPNFSAIRAEFVHVEHLSTAQVVRIIFLPGNDPEDKQKEIYIGYEHLNSLIDVITSIEHDDEDR